MTERNRKRVCKVGKREIDIMIRGYQEMAEINLAISRMCFEVEREVESFYNRLTECE
mgnify:CR=1 FL=1